jgi:hypothetical protein
LRITVCREIEETLALGGTDIARVSKLTVSEVFVRLKAVGLDSMPGGGGEILDDEIWQDRLQGLSWLFELPISRNRLFLLIGTLPFGFYELANLYGFNISHRPARKTIAMLLVSTTVSLSLLLITELSHISLLPGISSKWFSRLALTFWLVILGALFLYVELVGKYNSTLTILDRVSKILPSNIVSLCILATTIITILYTAAFSAFRRLEVHRKSIPVST